MKITNKYNVPEPLVALANKQYYSKGAAAYSVTEIIAPPQIQRLRRLHDHEMEIDVSELLWQMLGSALHVVAERSQVEGHTSEERLFVEVDGVTFSGAIDLQHDTDDGIVITDYKFTSAWALRNEKIEWVRQQNIYAWLVAKVKGKKVSKVRICAFIRDWSRHEAAYKDGYPKAPIQVLTLPLWPLEKTEAYIRERIEAHRQAKVSEDWNEPLPKCSDEDRWQRPTMFAVKKEGRKTAIRVLDSLEAAKALAEQQKGYVEERKAESIRCGYCGVKQWCEQYRDDNLGATDGKE